MQHQKRIPESALVPAVLYAAKNTDDKRGSTPAARDGNIAPDGSETSVREAAASLRRLRTGVLGLTLHRDHLLA